MIVHFIPCCPIMCHNSCYINAIHHVRAVFTDSLLPLNLYHSVPLYICRKVIHIRIHYGDGTCVNDPLTAAFVARVKTPGRYGDGGHGGSSGCTSASTE